MTKCYVFDLDSTLADPTHRLWYIQKPDPDWRGFFAACGGDEPIVPIVSLYKHLWNGAEEGQYEDRIRYYAMIIVSGRSDECLPQTEVWLQDVANLAYHALYMRKAGDHRPDHLVKSELLDQMLADGWEPILFIDDRQQVVDMWRSRGYTCLQCAPGSF
jgi:hypothetical protein